MSTFVSTNTKKKSPMRGVFFGFSVHLAGCLGYSSEMSEQGVGGNGAIRTNHFGKPLSRSKRDSSKAICAGVSRTPV